MGLFKNNLTQNVLGDELLDIIPALLTSLAAIAFIVFAIIKNIS